MIDVIESQFVKSAQSVQDSLPTDMSEIAFLGRSNVGKSSLLNSLCNRKGLAKSSSTPGKTRLINFFAIKYKNRKTDNIAFIRFVDLPGFGYAKVSKSLKEEWGKNLTNFLENRFTIRIFVHLIDARHIGLKIDNMTSDFLNNIIRKDQIILKVFTKVDKLKARDLNNLKLKFKDGIFISNLKKSGIDKLNKAIYEYSFGEM